MALILLTNDDGVYSPGILTARRHLASLGTVELIAPNVERSGVAHAVSIDRPLRIRPAHLDGQLIGHMVNGSPVDCVKVGIRKHLDRRPDLLVSGINLGQNAGIDVLYSGTVAAALEGALLGVRSVALSLATKKDPDFEAAARIVRPLIERLLDHPLPPRTMLNVNIPPLPEGEIRGFRLTRQSTRAYDDDYDRRTDPRGETYYWIDGRMDASGEPDDTDLAALRDGYVSVTPLSFDLTYRGDRAALEDLIGG